MSGTDSVFVRKLRKWMRILHRDLGFFFVGASIIYGLSGLALNHLKDWNPNYKVVEKEFVSDISLTRTSAKEDFDNFLSTLPINEQYKSHSFVSDNEVKIFLTGKTIVEYNNALKTGVIRIMKRRPVFYQANYLHYNPNVLWTIFSDAFAVGLIFFAISGMIIIKGKKGVFGSGGIYVLLGIIIPLLILFFA